MELNIDRITKQYGSKIAVDRISLTLKPGVTGLLGANGAGKTTAFWARWCAGVSFAAGLTLAFSVVYIQAYCVFYGPDGFSTALQLWSEGVALPLHLSMGGYVLVVLVLGGLCWLSYRNYQVTGR